MKLLRHPVALSGTTVLAVRCALGAALVAFLPVVSVDDYFRVFHAAWWWDNISFTTSHEWLPGHSYLFGLLVGLTGDTLVAPRILSTGLILLLGAVLLVGNRDRGAPIWIALSWALLSPLALILGTVPLTEAPYVLALVSGAAALAGYVRSGKPLILLGATAAYLVAAMFRYEAWGFLPLFGILALRRRCEGLTRLSHVALSLLPWLYPLVWTLTLWAIQGEPLTYLSAVTEDHFGAGSLAASVASPVGLVSLLQVAVVIAAAAMLFVRRRRDETLGAEHIWILHVGVALVIVVAVAASGNVPSQFPVRILFPVIVLGAVPVMQAIGAIESRVPRLVANAGVLCVLGVGIFSLLTVEPGVEEGNLRAAGELRALFERGEIKRGAHVIVEYDLPDSAAMVVLSGHPEFVHVDNMGGGGCPPKMLLGMETICEFPKWAPRTTAAMVRPDGGGMRYLLSIGWKIECVNEQWALVTRPAGAPFPGEGLYVLPADVTTPPAPDRIER